MKVLRNQAGRIQVIIVFVAVFTLGFMAGNHQGITQAQTMGDTEQAFSVIQEVYSLIEGRFVDADKIEVPALVDGALKGMVESLGDQFSAYETPEQALLSAQSMEGRVEGIGATVDTNEDEQVFVAGLIRGAAAEAAGVLPGDIFWEVDGKNVAGIGQNDLVFLVRGPAGSDVKIMFKRGEEFVTFTITRVRFDVPIVETEVLEDDIAYLNLAQFTQNSADLVSQGLDTLDVNNKKALIIDIRDNPGGLLQAVIEITSFFKKDGVVLYEAFGDGTEQTFDVDTSEYRNITVPIIVLTNEGSASASELLAGALQDGKEAVIMGETTFGKGTVQTIQPLSNGGALRITIARWLTPNRNWIHKVGITPDIVVPYDPATDGVDIDPQLDAAIQYINDLGN